MKQYAIINALFGASLLVQANQSNPAALGLEFQGIRSNYRNSTRVRFSLKNHRKSGQHVVLKLQMLDAGKYMDCMADIYARTWESVPTPISLRPSQSKKLVWRVRAQTANYVPLIGRVYRFMAVNSTKDGFHQSREGIPSSEFRILRD